MHYHNYLICSFATICLVASLIGWSMATGVLLIPVLAIPLGLIVILACHRNIAEIVRDERVNEIRSVAARRTLELCIILGTIGAVILFSYVISEPLSPTITGNVITNADGSRSMEILMYRPGSLQTPADIIRSTKIPDIDAMNEFEAMEYSQFRRESFLENERKGLIGMVLGCEVIVMLALFGAFNLYYSRRY